MIHIASNKMMQRTAIPVDGISESESDGINSNSIMEPREQSDVGASVPSSNSDIAETPSEQAVAAEPNGIVDAASGQSGESYTPTSEAVGTSDVEAKIKHIDLRKVAIKK